MKQIILFCITILLSISVLAQLSVNAGDEKNICLYDNDTISLGGNPTVSGGTPPYTYCWSFKYQPYYYAYYASDILDDTSSANPSIVNFIDESTIDLPYLQLTVYDSLGNYGYDSVKITFSYFIDDLYSYTFNLPLGDSLYVDMGTNLSGGIGKLSYLWKPNYGLLDSTNESFWTKPDSSTSYYVVLTDSFGCQITGSPFIYVNVFNTGLEELNNTVFSIHPNPAKNNINLNIENIAEKNIILQIHNASGKLVMEKELPAYINEQQIDVSELASGNYFISLITKNGSNYSGQFIKQ